MKDESREYNRFYARLNSKYNDNAINIGYERINYERPFEDIKNGSDLNFDSSNIEHLEIKNSSFSKISFYGKCKIEYLLLTDCKIKEIHFEEVAEAEKVVIQHSGEVKIIFYQGDFKSVELLHNRNASLSSSESSENHILKIKSLVLKESINFRLTHGEIDLLKIEKNHHDYVYFDAKINRIHIIDARGEITLADRRFKEISLEGKFRSAITLKDLNVEILTLKGFDNYEQFIIENISTIEKRLTKIDIEDSTLRNVVFSNIDFREYKTFIFNKTSLISFEANNVTWPSKFIGDNHRLGDVYRDLKGYYSNKHQSVTAQKFKALEYETYRKREDFSWQDRFIFILNESNNHGQNYFLPFGLIWGVNALTFLIYFAFDNCIIQEWGLYFNLFNPVRSLDFIEPFDGLRENRNWIIMIDFVSRGIISYLIFQTIYAFRKFSK